ncbi:MAG: metal ABC transporter permease [Motiliproteus sp.]|nr:metal ABC transporter permease [Motiliproteus sp.]MCW9052511.1 metal ABC transporter permease [Motiliproteus sp.]
MGVIVAFGLGWDDHGWETQLAAVIAALLGAAAICAAEKFCRREQEALIGVGFVLAATASILLLADNPQGGEHLRELLVGQILWVSWSQLFITAIIALSFLLLWFLRRQAFSGIGFYLLFAIAITTSVQLVGVYLVFASLIIPALAVSSAKAEASLWLGYGVGVLGYMLGLMASSVWDLPSGAAITWSLALVAVICRTCLWIIRKPLNT